MNVYASEPDTIPLERNQILLLKDTIYFGINDSIVILKEGTKYKVKKEKPKTQELLYEGYMSLVLRQQGYEEELKDGKVLNTRNYFEPYKGKVIKKIYFKQVDLLEGSVVDTSITSVTGFGKFLSSLHKNTKPKVIKNNLRFKENDELNDVIMAENERLLRGLPYIEDAKIYIREEYLSADSVDVYVVTKDKFPIGIGMDYRDLDEFIVDLYSKNVNGMGHEAKVTLDYNKNLTRTYGYGFEYVIENVKGSFARTSIEYLNLASITKYGLNVTKPFSTNDVTIGGSINVANTKTVKGWTQYEQDSSYVLSEPFKANTGDVWFGKSFFLTKNVYDKFINVGARFFYENHVERPYVAADSNLLFHDNHTFLANATFKNINYFKANKLLGYGVPEDVPVGYYVQLTGGYRKYEFSERPYFGVSATWTTTSEKLGYYMTSISIGGFPADGKIYDDKIIAKIVYFSPLFKLKRFDIRNILIPSFLSTENPVYLNDINFKEGIRGLDQYAIHGFSNFILRYESFLYTPYTFAGFKTAISLFADSGWITSKGYLTGEMNFYGAYGIAIHIKNESLTIPALAVQVAYYPYLKNEIDKFKITFVFSDLRFFTYSQSLKPNPYSTF